MATYPSFPKSFGVLYFPGFEVLDIAGPLEALNCLSRLPGFEDLNLSIISRSLDPVNVGDGDSNKFMLAQQYLPTHTFDTAPPLDVLLIPGGMGAAPHPSPNGVDHSHIQDFISFVNDVYFGRNGKTALKYILSICNGASIMSAAGVLDGKRATTNKAYWQAITDGGTGKIHWVAKARWVDDGNVWTTSGVSAGTDGTLAWMNRLLPDDVVAEVVKIMEWIQAKTPDEDPFAEGLEDVLPKM